MPLMTFNICAHACLLQVNIMNNMINEQVRMKLDCGHVLAATHGLLSTLSLLDAAGKSKCGLYLREDETEQVTSNFIVLVFWGFLFFFFNFCNEPLNICCLEGLCL